jgi:hypothetical protein
MNVEAVFQRSAYTILIITAAVARFKKTTA